MADVDQPDLFGDDASLPPASGPVTANAKPAHQPLAARMRPRRLSEVVGQEHILKPGSLLPRLVAQNRFGSLLFYGPPGCGKTSIAEAIARETNSRFVRVNAVMSNVAELRQILHGCPAAAGSRATILFIDELHRFNKSQQDLLLPDVEEGNVRLIGATTHNPGFLRQSAAAFAQPFVSARAAFNRAVVSVLKQALTDSERGLGARGVTASDKILADLAVLCDGDMRRALNSLEVLRSDCRRAELTEAELEVFARERRIRYDADEDEHYDTISAFIKSCRGSDPDAAMYWLAKMLAGGEDPRFIARRLVILASEDVGLADPQALPLTVAASSRGRLCGAAGSGAYLGARDALHCHRSEKQLSDARAGRSASRR